MTQTRNRGRKMSGPTFEWIKAMHIDQGWTPMMIHKHLLRLRPSSRAGEPDQLEEFLTEHEADELPSYDQIKRTVRELKVPDASGPWSPRDTRPSPATEETPVEAPEEWLTPNPEDLRIILDVLAWVSIDTRGKKTTVTKKEAKWILRIAKAAPTATSRIIWRLAKRYMLADARKEPTEALDTYVAFKPWENANRCLNFNYLVKQGWIRETPGREEIDGFYDQAAELGYLESHFKDGAYQLHPLDHDPLYFRRQLGGRWSEKDKWMQKIRERQPWIYHRILKVWEDARESDEQASRDAGKRADEAMEALGDAAPDDEEEWMDACSALTSHFLNSGACYDKYESLVDFFKDDAALKMDSKQIEEEFNRILNAPEEDQDKGEPDWYVELKKKSKKSKRAGKRK